jgi:hypothetical protein
MFPVPERTYAFARWCEPCATNGRPPPLPVPLQDITTLSRCLPEDVLSSTTFFVLIFMGYTSAHIAIFGS